MVVKRIPSRMLVKSVAFPLAAPLPSEAVFLLQDFRLAANNAIRAGILARVSSRNALAKLIYKDFRIEHPGMYSQHLVCAFEVAGTVLKNYRRRLVAGKAVSTPYVKRLTMKAENQAYKLDRENGVIDLPIRARCHVKLGSLTLLQDRVLICFRREAPKPYVAESALSLDTNERSLDGIFVKDGAGAPIKADFSDVAIIQQRHYERRKRFQKKKAHDRRTSRRLTSREGRREHHRVEYRLHQVADAVLDFAEANHSAIIIEDLTGIKPKGGKALKRRLSSWPRRKLHEIMEYKSQWRGIPLVKVDPRNSSRTCPICGSINKSRIGKVFNCECGWSLDRHINASINLLQTASSKGLAGGLRFSPGAFQHDVMKVLCDPARGARPESNGTSQSSKVVRWTTTRRLTEPPSL
ncbi:MAG: zinc ribbon domain-containing protein, partial [Candidatus Thermoplasmatota archaeon]|nr:zinc ribbon domain-containing protein [Candidatus Thermoplasmatota archaeon]